MFRVCFAFLGSGYLLRISVGAWLLNRRGEQVLRTLSASSSSSTAEDDDKMQLVSTTPTYTSLTFFVVPCLGVLGLHFYTEKIEPTTSELLLGAFIPVCAQAPTPHAVSARGG